MRNIYFHALIFGSALALAASVESVLLLFTAMPGGGWRFIAQFGGDALKVYLLNCVAAAPFYAAMLYRRRDGRGVEIRIGHHLAPSFWLGAVCGACSGAPGFVGIYLHLHFAKKLAGIPPGDLRLMAMLSVICCAVVLPMLAGWIARGCLAEPVGQFCPTCGYDLRATPERCPECGTRVGSPRRREDT